MIFYECNNDCIRHNDIIFSHHYISFIIINLFITLCFHICFVICNSIFFFKVFHKFYFKLNVIIVIDYGCGQVDSFLISLIFVILILTIENACVWMKVMSNILATDGCFVYNSKTLIIYQLKVLFVYFIKYWIKLIRNCNEKSYNFWNYLFNFI